MKAITINCALIGTIILWASAFIGIKIGLQCYSPGALALLRFLVASGCIAIIYQWHGIRQSVAWYDRLLLALCGIVGIGVYNICLNIGEITVTAGIASFVIGLMPVLTILLSLIFLKEKQRYGVWLGVAVSLLGLVILALCEGTGPHLMQGVGLILVSTLTGAFLTIVQRYYAKIYHPVAIIAWVIWGGTLFLLWFLPDLLKEFPVAKYESTLSAVYMGIFPGAIAYLAWGIVLRHVSASKTSISLYAMPILSTLLGFLLLHEQPGFTALLGGSITIAGAFVARYHQEREPIAPPDTDFYLERTHETTS